LKYENCNCFSEIPGCDSQGTKGFITNKTGKKVQVLQYENRLELIPVRSIKKMRGFLKGIDTTVRREKDRV
jgi:hypothetical protein